MKKFQVKKALYNDQIMYILYRRKYIFFWEYIETFTNKESLEICIKHLREPPEYF